MCCFKASLAIFYNDFIKPVRCYTYKKNNINKNKKEKKRKTKEQQQGIHFQWPCAGDDVCIANLKVVSPRCDILLGRDNLHISSS